MEKIGDPVLVQQLTQNHSSRKHNIKFLLLLIAFVLTVIALANPRLPSGTEMVTRSGMDLMIALDVSKSMLAQDILPSRIERARQLVGKLIDQLPEIRVGLVVFAGRAYLQMPLTADHAAAKLYVSSATPDVVPTQGTVIGDALKMCYSSFREQEHQYRSVLLISDGEDHDDNAVKVAKAIAAEGVMISTVGIGSPEGALISDPQTNEPKKDAEGNPVITKLDEATLKSIAGAANGIYLRFTETESLVASLAAKMAASDSRTFTEKSSARYRYLFPWILMVVLILLLLELLLSDVRKIRAVPGPLKTAAVLILFMVTGTSVYAQKENKLVKKGNQAYQEKKYSQAVSEYRQALRVNPSGSAARFNLGNALYRSGQANESLNAYDSAIIQSATPMEKSGAWYNKGVVLQQNKKLPECIEAYKNALRLNPTDSQARFNLQKALVQQKQQQQQKEKKQNQQQQQQKKEQQQQQKKDQPQPSASKMTKQEAEEKLKALMQQEKNLQDKLHKVNAASPNKPEKDW